MPADSRGLIKSRERHYGDPHELVRKADAESHPHRRRQQEGRAGGPVLLTRGASLPAETVAELERLDAAGVGGDVDRIGLL